MRKTAVPNGYITLKIALLHTKIARTVVVPAHMTLDDLNRAIQAVMGWDDSHLWHFTDKRSDGVIFELPHMRDDNPHRFAKKLTLDASKFMLNKLFRKRGDSLFYEYGFGDSWLHLVTRQADPKTPEIACVKTQGPDGIEDFGGQCRLAKFIAEVSENPQSEESIEYRQDAGLDSDEDLQRYLAGETAAEKTARLRRALAHVKPPAPSAHEEQSPIPDDEQARLLGLAFSTLAFDRAWAVMDEAMRNGGTCKFNDPDKSLGEFFLSTFDGLKVKDGRCTAFHVEPSELTVPSKWVELYKQYGKIWQGMCQQTGILESYAASCSLLYGVVSLDELMEIILRYDPGFCLSRRQLEGILSSRTMYETQALFRIEGDLVISEDLFPEDIEDIGQKIIDFRENQSEFPRWYPQSSDELLKWEDMDSWERTPESDAAAGVLRSHWNRDAHNSCDEAVCSIYRLLCEGLRAETVYSFLEEHDIVPKLSGKWRSETLEAIDRWYNVVHMARLNGNTPKALREASYQPPKQPKVGRNAPCPCGSGKKFKNCCGRNM